MLPIYVEPSLKFTLRVFGWDWMILMNFIQITNDLLKTYIV